MSNFAFEIRAEVGNVSIFIWNTILITCSGDAARQFYNPLQARYASLISAALDGRVPANVALLFNGISIFIH